MVKILHTADVHLDRSFSGLGMSQGIAGARREELRAAVRRLVDLALETRADALTIGGDLYEHDRVTPDTGNFLRQQFERLGAVRVFIAPGNHDPYVPDSLYRRIDWPPNVTVFAEAVFRAVPLADGVTLWGAAHDGPALRRNLLSGFRVSGAGQHLLLFHGSDTQAVPEGKTTHAPFLPTDIEAAGASFALLGHYHRARLHPETSPRFAYPGSPEPLDFSEAGDHFVLQLDIDGGELSAELLPFGRVPYAVHRIDVSQMQSSDDARTALESLPAGGLVRAVLSGQLSPDVSLDSALLYSLCAERFTFLDLVDQTEPGYNWDELAAESTTKGAFVRLMLARLEGAAPDDQRTVQQALLFGLRAFDRRELSV